jgi:predicted nucleotidyltransferase
VGAFHFLDVKEHLESVLARPVDLVTPAAIKPRMRQRILDEVVDAAP